MKITVLGAGYVGSHFVEKYDCAYSYRSNQLSEESFFFDLNDRSSWQNIPDTDVILLTFAIKDLALLQDFYHDRLKYIDKVYIYASTSCYQVKFNEELISEESDLVINSPRVECEEWLRQQGATVVTLSGIFGPNRMPENWLKKGLIKNANKTLNLIHVDDIVELTYQFIQCDLKGERINLSNGEKIYWYQLAEQYGIECPKLELDRFNKFIGNEKLLSFVGNYQFEKILVSEGEVEVRLARVEDIPQVLELHYRYQVDSIADEDKKDGFITTAFTEEQMRELIEKESGLSVVIKDGRIVAYAMAASWQFWSLWPMFAHMIKDLPNLEYNGYTLSTENSFQYGPVCVDKSVRGQGVFELVFNFSLKSMSSRYPVLVTFINKINPRSYAAHTQKVALDVIQEFSFNDNQYYELACLTERG